jgi:hypothetical protein
MRFSEQNKIVHCLEPEDHAAGVDGGDAVLTINSGATAGTKTTAETFNYRACATDLKSAGGDLLAAETTSAALTLTAATYEDRFIVVEMDDSEFTAGQPWITPTLSSAASECFASIVAIMSKPRFASDVPPTVIA